jgi:hypothetical protein
MLAQPMAIHSRDRRALHREEDAEAPERASPAHAVLGLQQALGNQAVARLVARHKVEHTKVDRMDRTELLGDGTAANPGATLGAFESSLGLQADWFQEPTLSDADRAHVWSVLRRINDGRHILAGAGDLHMPDLIGVADADWAGLSAFGRACHAGSSTIRIDDASTYTLAQRIDIGKTLVELEKVIQPDVLRLTASETQLKEIHAAAMVPAIAAYWAAFSPHMQEQFEAKPGARGPEFQRMMDLIAGGGHARFNDLLGRVRNLHRFSVPMLTQLLVNFKDTGRTRPADLVLHTGHDESAFNESAFLFTDLVVNSPHNVLFLEGQASLAAITAEIPKIAATYGQPDDKGVPRLAQTMIAGHGEARVTELAGTGNERIQDNQVVYDSESLDLDNNNGPTLDLLNALIANMDAKTARLVFAGCLVGSNFIPAGTPAGSVVAQMNAQPSLGPFTEALGVSKGMPAGFTQSARASVGLSEAKSLMDASGRFTIDYPFDPKAFADSLQYIAEGHEPEGLLRAVVEVIATKDAKQAETQLRIRQAKGVDEAGHDWWDEMTMAAVNVALDGVAVGSGVDHNKILALSHMVGVPFLARWAGSYGRDASTYVSEVNTQGALATKLYAEVEKTLTWRIAPDLKARGGRLIGEQGWMMLPEAREAALIAFLDAHADYKAEQIAQFLDPGVIAPKAGTLFGGAPTSGSIRLALAWLSKQPGTVAMQDFLKAQVQDPGTGPEFTPAVKAELGNMDETGVLMDLGVVAMGGGPDPLPKANAEVWKTGSNRVRIEPQPYEAEVIVDVAHVRDLPGLHGQIDSNRKKGAKVDVMGFVHEWAAIDQNGRIGFIRKDLLTPP